MNLPDTDDAVKAVEEDKGVRILDETPHSMFVEVRTEDGWEQMNKAKNARNELLFKHGLWSLVRGSGDDIYQFGDDRTARIMSEQDSTYVIWVDDLDPVHTSPEMETEVLQAIREVVNRSDVRPLASLHGRIRDEQVRWNVLSKLLDEPPFSVLVERGVVEHTDKGWLVHDNMLVTWDVELRNQSDTDSYRVSGSGVRSVESTNNAFDLTFDVSADENVRQDIELDGESYKLGEREMEFVATVLWVVKNIRPRGGRTGQDGTPDESDNDQEGTPGL